jgi:hypothetical protein
MCADHAPIGHPAHLTAAEALSQAIDHGEQSPAIRVVPRPQLAADRASLTREHGAHDHLVQVGAVIFRVPVRPEMLPALALEVHTGHVKERQREIGEEIAALVEQGFLHRCLGLAQPAHSAVEVVQLQAISAGEVDVPSPALSRPVRARLEEAVQHR